MGRTTDTPSPASRAEDSERANDASSDVGDAELQPSRDEATAPVSTNDLSADAIEAAGAGPDDTSAHDSAAADSNTAESNPAASNPTAEGSKPDRRPSSPDTVLEEHRQSIASILKSLTDSLAPAANPDGEEPGESLRRSLIGQRIGNYEIMSCLSSGGMGDVFEATHTLLQRKVAIKVLRPEHCADQALVHRFFNEARAANSIRHPNVVEVVDVGLLPGGLPYIAMECLEGETLAERLKREGPLDIDGAADFAAQAAAALRAVHKQGIVHRDLKPDNLFIVADPRVEGHELIKLLDFGIAKLRDDKLSNVRTNAGSILGTPPYMSPEQCRGVPDAVDHRSDIYALGVILFEMLCGAPPFVAEGVGDVMVMHLSSPPPLPTWRRKEIPARIEQTILRALEKNPDQRIPTMADFIFALGNGPTPVPYILTPTGLTADLATQALLAQHARAQHGRELPLNGPQPNDGEAGSSMGYAAAEARAARAPSQRPSSRTDIARAAAWMSAAAIIALAVGWIAFRDPARDQAADAGVAARHETAKAQTAPAVAQVSMASTASREGSPRADGPLEAPALPSRMMSIVPGESAPQASDGGAPGPTTSDVEGDGQGQRASARRAKRAVSPSRVGGSAVARAPANAAGPAALDAPMSEAPTTGPAEAAAVDVWAPTPASLAPTSDAPTSNAPVSDAPAAEPPIAQPPASEPSTAHTATVASPPPAVVLEFGVLNLDSEPGTNVTFNGRLLGKTPLRGVLLPAGTQHLQLDNEELGLSTTYRVEILAGKTIFKSAILQ